MSVADRFAEYVAELHELSDSHRLPHGKPKDLLRLLEAFQNSEMFADDFGCALRSIAIREHFNASETELLTLIAVAWAGAEPDDSTPQLSQIIQDLRRILNKSLAQKVLGHRLDGPISASTEIPEEMPDVSTDLPEITPEPETTGHDVRIHPRLLPALDSGERRHGAAPAAPVQPDPPVQGRAPSSPDAAPRAPEPPHSGQNVSPYGKWERRIKEDRRKSDRRKPSAGPLAYASDAASENSRTRRLEPSATEILAMGLVGLMTALLFSVGSLPIYRARVSVYLPPTTAGVNGSLPGVLHSGSGGESLLNGGLTEKVAQGLLARPDGAAILRQDVLSRTMRDLHLGGNETILYADLVAETARQVKVTPLPQHDLYEVTCDSWSAQFATTFCNQLTDSLVDQPSAAIPSPGGTEAARIVDAATQPGSPVYPHWYLQGFAGLVGGCLIGVLPGFVKRPKLKPVKGNDLPTQ